MASNQITGEEKYLKFLIFADVENSNSSNTEPALRLRPVCKYWK